ncbi:MAG: hypothetical protein ABFC96_10765, partial [Thermoguttaceae bacterium]
MGAGNSTSGLPQTQPFTALRTPRSAWKIRCALSFATSGPATAGVCASAGGGILAIVAIVQNVFGSRVFAAERKTKYFPVPRDTTMKQFSAMLVLLALSAVLSLAAPLSSARATITATSGTASVSPANPNTWDGLTTCRIGDTANGIVTVDGGSDLLSSDADIGYRAGVTGTATVEGAGSTWASGALNVGVSGSGSLNITHGGVVQSCASSKVGLSSGSNGTVTVDGADSKWVERADIYVGDAGTGVLTVSNGGVVSCNMGWIGKSSGSNGTVIVQGAGSRWTSGGTLYVGYSGGGTLNITNGGVVSDTTGFIGENSGGKSVVTVDGAGSMWTNSRELYVGRSGAPDAATLRITNGGCVSATGTTYVGSPSSSDMSTIDFGASGGTLTTAGLVASASEVLGTGTVNARGLLSDVAVVFDSNRGLQQTITLNGLPNQNVTINLDMSDAAKNGVLGAGNRGAGSLTIQDGLAVTSTDGFVGYSHGSSGIVTVSGPGSNWTNSNGLTVGFHGAGTLCIAGGATVSNKSCTIGYGGAGTVTVDGAGSVWDNCGDLRVGSCGTATLNIVNGGSVSVAGTTYVSEVATSVAAINFGACGGTLTTAGLAASPSQLSGTGTINARGLLTDASLVFNADHGLQQTITLNSLPNQNVAISLDMSVAASNGVLGAGWRDAGSLAIQDGLAVTSTFGYVGYASGSSGVATVSGAGSTWAISKSMYVGHFGSGTLTIGSGGTVSSDSGYLGCCYSSSIGTATVEGAGATWANRGDLYVGVSGRGTLTVANGGTVTSREGNIGYDSSSTGTITVRDAGSTWTNSGDLYVGRSGAGTLNIVNGAAVSNGVGWIGYSCQQKAAV